MENHPPVSQELVSQNENPHRPSAVYQFWGLVDYCIRERPGFLNKFLREIAEGKAAAAAFAGARAAESAAEFDAAWREFIREKY